MTIPCQSDEYNTALRNTVKFWQRLNWILENGLVRSKRINSLDRLRSGLIILSLEITIQMINHNTNRSAHRVKKVAPQRRSRLRHKMIQLRYSMCVIRASSVMIICVLWSSFKILAWHNTSREIFSYSMIRHVVTCN